MQAEGSTPPPPARPAGLLRRALGFATPHLGSVVVISISTLFVAALNAAEPLLLKWVFDGLAHWEEPGPVFRAVFWLAVIGILREAATGLSNWLTWSTRLGIHFRLLEDTVGRLHRMPLRLQRSEGVGATITRLDRSIAGFLGAVTQLLFQVLPAVLYLGIAVVVMVRLDWELALLVIAFTPLPALIAARAAPEQTRRERTLLDQWARIYSRFNEVLSGLVTVRSFAMEDMEKQRFLRDVESANRVVSRGVGLDSGLGAASNLIVALARFCAIAVGGVFVINDAMSIGTLIAFLGYVGGLFGPVQGLTSTYSTLQRASVSMEEIVRILDVQEHLGDAPDARDLPAVRGEVEFEHVTFRYEQEGRPLLSDVSLRAAPGETVAIVGPSGSGKTTLMALLMRFYDPLSGRVLVDGHDLRQIRQRSLRRQIGVVLQDPLLFNDTVRNNISYGRPEATAAEVESAARAANAHDFITRLPEGYDTIVGERGSRLSLGERQRLTIARALVKNPGIIVLDEATSSLDAESEAQVQEALESLMRGRTTFVIAHRLATVVNAHRILVLKDGHVAESGTHRELLRLDGYYAGLVRRQTRGLILNDGDAP